MYQYCSSLIFEFWQLPFQVEYGRLVQVLARATCSLCSRHGFGSPLYVQVLAALGAVTTVLHISRIIAAPAIPRYFARDIQLMASTLGVLVYLMLWAGVLCANPFLLVPWMLFQAMYLVHSASRLLLYSPEVSHPEPLVFALLLNNMLQVLCIFLKLITKSCK